MDVVKKIESMGSNSGKTTASIKVGPNRFFMCWGPLLIVCRLTDHRLRRALNGGRLVPRVPRLRFDFSNNENQTKREKLFFELKANKLLSRSLFSEMLLFPSSHRHSNSH